MLSLLLLAIVLIFVPLYPYFVVYTKIVRHTFRPMWLEPADAAQMPSEIRDLMQPWIARLTTYDFTITSYHYNYGGLINEEPYWCVILSHSSQKIFAKLLVKPKPIIQYPVICTLSSYWQETDVSTVNFKNSIPYRKSSLEHTNYLDKATIKELWLSHQSFVGSICSVDNLEKLTVEEWICKTNQTTILVLECRVKNREIYWVNKSEHTYRKHPWLAFKMLVSMVNENRSRVNESGNSKTHVSNEQIELEIRNFLDRPQKSGLGMSKNQRILLLASSFIIFIATYATQFQPVKLLIFVLVLVFHELGHISAMAAFGYRDTAMLFIPWLGALATGHKENASLSEKVWISLAGPLPGLIIGIVLTLAFPTDRLWLKDASVMLIVINLFNLIPIYPLDGGQVVDLLIFSRRPYLAVVFQSIGVILLGSLGITQPLMMIFAALIGLGIPHNFRLAKLRFDFTNDFPDLPTDDREALVRTVFRYLSMHKYRHLSFPLKIWLVDSLLDNQRQDRSNRLTRWGLTIFYLMSLIGSFIFGASAIFPTIGSFVFRGALQKHFQDQIELANRQIQKNPKDASAYLKRSWGYYLSGKKSAALIDIDRAILLDPNNSSAYNHRSLIRRSMGDLAGAKTDQQQSHQISLMSQLKYFDRIIQEKPDDVSAYVERGKVKKMMNDKLGADADYQMALKLTPHAAADFIGRASLELETNNHKQALLDVNRALELEPKNAEAYDLRASLYEKMGNMKQAEIDRHKAETLNEN
jgi:tetratricopeptide (TPR) repeat protein/Zn-dependent protease